MKRIAYTINLVDDPKLIEDYCEHHRNVWPEVEAGLKQVGLIEMNIYRLGRRLFMLMEDQSGVGDWVDVGDTSGVVEHVGLRTTRVRSLDGLLWTVRNGEIVRTANANQGWGRAIVDIGVGYDVDLDEAQDLIHRIATQAMDDPALAPKFQGEPEIWGIQELGDDAVTIRLVVKSAPGDQWGLARGLRLRIKQALDDRGMEIPFPQRTVWLRTEPDSLDAAIPLAVGDANGQG